jgi:broad specificity polyphosphatase/5'/3'-nucleotidase SurE
MYKGNHVKDLCQRKRIHQALTYIETTVFLQNEVAAFLNLNLPVVEASKDIQESKCLMKYKKVTYHEEYVENTVNEKRYVQNNNK